MYRVCYPHLQKLEQAGGSVSMIGGGRMPDTGILQAERTRQAGCQFVSIALGRMDDRRPAHDLD